MSTSSTAFTYNFNLTLRDTASGNSESAYPIFTNASGMTDALAIAFARAWQALPLPSGTTAQALVTRHETDDTQSEGDLTNGVFV